MIVYYRNIIEVLENEKRDDDKEKSIKEAVIKLILQEGFHGTSISKIAKAAGVSPATVYIYYENKEVMLQGIYILNILKRFLNIYLIRFRIVNGGRRVY